MPKAVFFDLDGTLADTAPDLGGALNTQRGRRGLPPLPIASLRPEASKGARGLIRLGFDKGPGDMDFEDLRAEFLELYESRLAEETILFPGTDRVLAALEERKLPWGVVTNKAERYTHPLLKALGLARRAACVVGGDTTPHAKPHPEPLLHAARLVGVAPADCIYVGDDRRDIEAGRAAGMRVVAARYGYLGGETDLTGWRADAIIDRPEELLPLLEGVLC